MEGIIASSAGTRVIYPHMWNTCTYCHKYSRIPRRILISSQIYPEDRKMFYVRLLRRCDRRMSSPSSAPSETGRDSREQAQKSLGYMSTVFAE